jgi:hypothetical protein
MLEARRGAWWDDASKIGLSPPPIETSRGWLVFYHGVRRHTPSGCLYGLGLALFELEKPEKSLLRGDTWSFGPKADYEPHSDVDDVVFPCGYTMNPDADTINLYYGAADCSLPWYGLAFVLYWSGSIPMGVANAGSERMMYGAITLDHPVCLRVSSQATERCIHDQEADLSDLPRVRTGISIFVGTDTLRPSDRG